MCLQLLPKPCQTHDPVLSRRYTKGHILLLCPATCLTEMLTGTHQSSRGHKPTRGSESSVETQFVERRHCEPLFPFCMLTTHNVASLGPL